MKKNTCPSLAHERLDPCRRSVYETLARATAASWHDSEVAAGSVAVPCSAGDLFALAVTSHLAVEWLLLAPHPRRRSFYAVPADTCQLLGSNDIFVSEETNVGPLSLRCKLGLWLAEGFFDLELRSGAVDNETLAAALRAVPSPLPWACASRFRAPHFRDDEISGALASEENGAYRRWIEDGPLAARRLCQRLGGRSLLPATAERVAALYR